MSANNKKIWNSLFQHSTTGNKKYASNSKQEANIFEEWNHKAQKICEEQIVIEVSVKACEEMYLSFSHSYEIRICNFSAKIVSQMPT